MKTFKASADLKQNPVKDKISTNMFRENFPGIMKDIVTIESRTCYRKN